MTRGFDAVLRATRVEPDVSLLEGMTYRPSWQQERKTTVVPYLSGHRGLVGALRDQIARNTPEADMEPGYEWDAAGRFKG